MPRASSSRYLKWVHRIQPITSTQDDARQLLNEEAEATARAENDSSSSSPRYCLAVLADVQTAGRGTQGRAWKGAEAPGANLHLTVAVPLEQLSSRISPITLTPLHIGTTVARRISQQLSECRRGGQEETDQEPEPRVSVKWPNDVLIQDAKVSGTLIETHTTKVIGETSGTTWLLIGIGINVAERPTTLDDLPGKHGRKATALLDWCDNECVRSESGDDTCSGSNETEQPDLSTAASLGRNLANDLAEWFFSDDIDNNSNTCGDPEPSSSCHVLDPVERGRHVLDEWKKWAQFGQKYELRGAVVDEEVGGYEGEQVVVLGVDDSGQLLVRSLSSGQVRLLSAEYMF